MIKPFSVQSTRIDENNLFICSQKRKHDGDDDLNDINRHKKSKVTWRHQIRYLTTFWIVLMSIIISIDI